MNQAAIAIGCALALSLPAWADDQAALPPVSAQFVASAVEQDAWREEPAVVVEIEQSEHWRRETRASDQGVGTQYTDSQSGAAITWYRAHDDSREVLTAHVAPASGYQSVTHAITDRTDHLLGQRCTIWEGMLRSAELGRQRTFETCVTSDGIILWERFHHRDGTVRETLRLTRLDRRRVRAADIMPPARLFQWRTWRDAAGGSIGSADDLELAFASPPPEEGSPPQTDAEIVRTSGPWKYTHTVDGGEWRSWRIDAPTLLLQYREMDNGTADRSLQIWRMAPASFERSDYAAPVEPARAETILGHSCTWFDTAIVSHHSIRACRTADGLALARQDIGDGARGRGYFDVRATSISRDSLSEADMAPPPQASDWPSR